MMNQVGVSSGLLPPSQCHFLASADALCALPAEGKVYEIAFWGRSNVGKSSLLNTLMGRKNLARCSKSPGCTKAILFYHVHPDLRFVDLPGYGYAKVPAHIQRRWDTLMDYYFSKRLNLRHVFLLIDGRHDTKPSDDVARTFLEETGVPYSVVFTKKDKTCPTSRQNSLAQVSPWRTDPLFPASFISARTAEGVNHLKGSIEAHFLR